MHYRSRHAQRGAALFVGVVLTMITTMVALSSMRGSQFQEGMTANLNHKAIAFTAAEAGASAFLKWLSTEQANNSIDWENATWQNKWQDSNSGPIQTSASGDNNVGNYGFFWINPNDVTWSADFVKVVITGQSGASPENALGRAQIAIQLQRPTSGGPHPAFLKGLLANGDISINGGANLQGSAHANGNFTVKGGGDKNLLADGFTVSANGTAAMDNVDENQVISNAGKVKIPSAKDYIEKNKGKQGVIQSCEIPSGDLGGAVYFCDGNVTTKHDFSNVTILAKGNVTHNGSSQLGENKELTAMIVSEGNIVLNGSSETSGIFWASGAVELNGKGTFGGAIIAGGDVLEDKKYTGDITKNGTLSFVQYDDFGDLNVPTAPASGLAITGWTEVLSVP